MEDLTSSTPAGNGPKFGGWDYLKITIFGFALTALWSSLHSIVLPVRLLELVDGSAKNTYLSLLTGTGLILAIIVQPVAGAISDRAGFRWGRRRPYILLGTLLVVLCLPGIGLATSYLGLLVVYGLLQLAANTAQGPFQAFIPDLVPEGKRGLASGVKGLLEILGGIALVRLVGYYMGRYFTGEGGAWLWPMVAVLAVVLLGAGLATVLLVRERPGTGGPGPPLWPVLRRSFHIDTRLAPGFSRFLVSRLLVLMAFATLQRFALYFLQDVVGVANPALVTADMIIVIGVGMLLAVYPAGRLSDRVGRWPVVMASGFVGAVGVVVLLFAHGYGQVVLGGGLLGISSGAFLSTDWALATDLVARGEEARYLGLTNLATAGGATLALFIIGPAIDFFNAYRPGLGYTVMLLACLAYFVAGSVLVVRLGRPQPR